MATESPRPGVEVVQEFQSTSPVILTPTLPPCIIAPFFEVIEVLNDDGTKNTDAQLADPYDQLEVLVSQSSFPSPRGNIDEVDVEEDSIRAFFDFGGSLVEMSREQAFLASINLATQASVTGTNAPGGGFDIDGRTLIFSVDSHTALPATAGTLPTADNITITFAATTVGGTLTIAEVVSQINAVYPGLAAEGTGADAGKLVLTSRTYGARSSIVVRKGGTANGVVDGLGFDTGDDEIAIGAGFYASDDADSDLLSPRVEFYKGTDQKLVAAADVPVVGSFDFTSYNILAGDTVVANGVDIGEVASVDPDRLTMEVEQPIMSSNNSFTPRYFWVRANNVSYPAPAASQAASQTGTIQTAAATQAYLVGTVDETSFNVAGVGASESITVDILKDGETTTEVISSGSGWANMQAMIDGINADADDFEAYRANDVGDELPSGSAGASTYLGLRTKADNTGSAGSITLSSSTVATEIGFTTLPASDVGENIRFLSGTRAFQIQGGVGSPEDWVTGGGTTSAQTITYTPTVKSVVKSAETVTWSASHAGDATGLANAIADWNSQALYTEAYEANAAGGEATSGGHFAVRTRGENHGTDASFNITASDTPVTLPTGTVTGTDVDLNGANFKWSIDNSAQEYDVNFVADEDDGGTSLQEVINKINAETPGIAAADTSSPPYLELTSQKVGEASEIEVLDGSANAALGFTDDTATTGNGRPASDMAIDISGNLLLQGQLLRDGLTGVPFAPASAPLLIAYKGLRLDLSPDADSPSMLSVDTISDLEELVNPISTDNPGALMMYLAKLNAPGVTISAVGVPETSADAPDGTPSGYSKAAEYLENEEVYALAMASQEAVVHQAFSTHVNFMSEPEQKGERIAFFNPEIPTRANADLLSSGTDANSTATADELLVEVNVAPALIAAGLDPNIDLNPTSGAIENEVYVDLGSDDKLYLVQKVTSGTTLTLRTSFVAGDGNDDSFFSEDALPTGIISDDWSLYIRGEELVITGSTRPDRNKIAETVQGAAAAYGDRRMYYVYPDQVGVNVTGLEQLVPGYYASACIAGMVAEQPPQQGFTNFPITGLTRVVGSNDQYTNRQLNVMGAGGVYILVQDVEGSPVISRHQLSTDRTSIETQELSITKIVDFCAKFYRIGLRNFIGRSNITQPFLDQLSTVVDGLSGFLEDNNVLIGADLNNLVQDSSQPDTVLVDITLDIPYPCNYVRLVLVI